MTRETYKLHAIDKVFYGVLINALTGARTDLLESDDVFVLFGKPDGSIVRVEARIDTLATIEGEGASETLQIHLVQNDPALFDQVGDWFFTFLIKRGDKEYSSPEKEYFWVVA